MDLEKFRNNNKVKKVFDFSLLTLSDKENNLVLNPNIKKKDDKDSFLTIEKSERVKKEKSDIIDYNIQEIVTPSQTLISKMKNIYGLISNNSEKAEVDDEDEKYSLNTLEKDFDNLIVKINPSLKSKILIKENLKMNNNNYNSRHLNTFMKYDKNKSLIDIKYNKVYDKNKFEDMNEKISNHNSKLRKLLNI